MSKRQKFTPECGHGYTAGNARRGWLLAWSQRRFSLGTVKAWDAVQKAQQGSVPVLLDVGPRAWPQG